MDGFKLQEHFHRGLDRVDAYFIPLFATVSLNKLIHPLTDYAIVERENQPEEDPSVAARLNRLAEHYSLSGIRRGVEAVMIVMDHGFPHILVLQVANAFYKLPGGYLDPRETDQEGLLARLDEALGVPDGEGGYTKPTDGKDWQVTECLSIWWRPNLDTFAYPYLPPHVSYPKECKKLYLVTLPRHKTFAVPANMKLHAIPVYEFYDNASRYGPQFAGLPYLLSKYWFPEHDQVITRAGPVDVKEFVYKGGLGLRANENVLSA